MSESHLNYTNRGVVIDGEFFISGDYHIGYSDTIDTMTFTEEKNNIINQITSVIENNSIEKFIINGDLFHKFQPASKQSREFVRNMRARIEVEECEFIVLSGNHDKSTQNEYPDLLDFKSELTIASEVGTISINHGHSMPAESDADLYVLSHLHPIVKINGVPWPSYLFGNNLYKNGDVLILPAFTDYQDGVTISDQVRLDIDFPMISPDQFKDLKPIVYDSNTDTVKKFPKLSKSSEFFGI